MKLPAFQFYPGDWLNDLNLGMCSLAAQGLWLRMMCVAHQGDPYGHLKVNHMVIPLDKLAELVGRSTDEIKPLIDELERMHVFSRDEDGAIYSRRMVSDEKKRQDRSTKGALGGNPVLKKSKENHKDNHEVNQQDKLVDKPSSSSSSYVLEEDEEEKTACLAYLKEKFPHWVLSGDKYVAFLGWSDRMPWSVIKMAAEETMAAGVNRLSYCEAILSDWEEHGVKTTEEALVRQAQKRVARGESRQPAKAPPTTPKPTGPVDDTARRLLEMEGSTHA